MFSWFSSSKPAAKEPVPVQAQAQAHAPNSTPIAAMPTTADAQAQIQAQTRQLQQSQQLQRTPKSPVTSQRSLRQLSLFFAGAGFLAWSTMITRRSVARKQLAALPKFYHPSLNTPRAGKSGPAESDGSLIAVEALGLATLNVFSFGMMMIGGLSWAFDISSVEELRALARRSIMAGVESKTDEESEREVQEWLAKYLSRGKEKKDESGS